MTKIKMVTLLIFIAVACLGCSGQGVAKISNDSQEKLLDNQLVNKDDERGVAETTDNSQGVLPDELFSYKGIELGMTDEEMLEIAGMPNKMLTEWELPIVVLNANMKCWVFDEFSVITLYDKVASINIAETSTGIRQGDPCEKVTDLHGEGTVVASIHDTTGEYYALHYAKDDAKQIWFHTAEGKVNFIEIGESFAD